MFGLAMDYQVFLVTRIPSPGERAEEPVGAGRP